MLIVVCYFAGTRNANVLEGTLPDASIYFAEKQIVAVSVSNAYLEGQAEAITYTDCEVYAANGILTDVRHVASRNFIFNSDICFAPGTPILSWFRRRHEVH